jgi:hypothetical protein
MESWEKYEKMIECLCSFSLSSVSLFLTLALTLSLTHALILEREGMES